MKFRSSGLTLVSLAAPLCLLLAACGSGSPSGAASPAGVTGVVMKGPVSGADVEFYEVDETGQAGAFLTSTVTDQGGDFTVPALPAGVPVLAIATGGEFFDESDPAHQRVIDFTDGSLEVLVPAGVSSFAITPYTSALLAKARAEYVPNGAFTFAEVYAGVLAQAQTAFGFDPVRTVPSDPMAPSGSLAAMQYGMLLGGAANAINAIALGAGHTPDLFDVQTFIDDFADGRLDAADLNTEIRRFRGNNHGIYASVPQAAVDEDFLAEPATPITAVPSLLPFRNSVGDLRLTGVNAAVVDAAQSGSVPENSPGQDANYRIFFAADYVAASGTLSKVRYARLAYIQSGVVYVVDLEGLGPIYAPTQISSITDACALEDKSDDPADPDNSVLYVRTAGPNGTCDTYYNYNYGGGGVEVVIGEILIPPYDDEFHMIRLDGTELDTDYTTTGIRQVVHEIRDPSTGAITGFLTVETDASDPQAPVDRVFRRDANLAAPATPIQDSPVVPPYYTVEAEGVAFDKVYVAIPSGQSTAALHRYNASTNSFTALYNYSSGSSSYCLLCASTYDANTFYFADGRSIRKVSHAGASASLVSTATGQVTELRKAGSSLVFETSFGVFSTAAAPASVPGAITTLRAMLPGEKASIFHADPTGNVFINISLVNSDGYEYAEKSLTLPATGGTAQDIDDTQYVGKVLATSFSVYELEELGISRLIKATYSPDPLYLVDSVNSSPYQYKLAVSAINPASPTAPAVALGEVPASDVGAVHAEGIGTSVGLQVRLDYYTTRIYHSDTGSGGLSPVGDSSGINNWLFFDDFDKSDSGFYGVQDGDGDGLSQAQESDLGTYDYYDDTDQDGLTDGTEYYAVTKTDPADFDTDNDEVGDGLEIEFGTSPTDGTGQSVYYVNPGCTAACDGTSWNQGFDTQAAVAAALNALPTTAKTYVFYPEAQILPGTLSLSQGGSAVLVGGMDSSGTVHYPNPLNPTTFDGSDAGSVIVLSNVGAVSFSDFVITNGSAVAGGGLYVDPTAGASGAVLLKRVKIFDNLASTDGGGIAAFAGTLTIEDSKILANVAYGTSTIRGGGIVTTRLTTIKNSVISENIARSTTGVAQGGGLATESTLVNIEDSIVTTNVADGVSPNYGKGGAVYGGSSGVNIKNSRIFANSGQIGAGIAAGGTLNVFNSLFSGNNATLKGGAIYSTNASNTKIEASTFAYNQVQTSGGGGAFYTDSSNAPVLNYNIFWFNRDASNGVDTIVGIGTPAGNNIEASGGSDPTFVAGFYLDQSVTGSVNAAAVMADSVMLGAPYTTDPAGTPDAGLLDFGFHHDEAARTFNGYAALVGSCGTHFYLPTFGDSGVEESGHRVVIVPAAGTAVGSINTVEPDGSGSRLATDMGDGRYRFTVSASGTADIYVDGVLDGSYNVTTACP